jgi:hypothetical protein
LKEEMYMDWVYGTELEIVSGVQRQAGSSCYPFTESRTYPRGVATLGEMVGLWSAYLKTELSGIDKDDPKYEFDALDRIFHPFLARSLPLLTDDACKYPGSKKLKKLRPTDLSVDWIIHPEAFIKTRKSWSGWREGYDCWDAKIGPDSEVKHIVIPSSGYVPLTCDGAFRPDTGTPFTTVKTREEAEQSWIKRGYTPEFAHKAAARFYSGDWSEDPYDGTYCVKRDSTGDGIESTISFDISAKMSPQFVGKDASLLRVKM